MGWKQYNLLWVFIIASALCQARELDEHWQLEQKVTAQLGHGPENSVLGSDAETFYGLRYDPTLLWNWPQQNWPSWQGVIRARIGYNSSTANNALNRDQRYSTEGTSLELTEFYLQRNLLWDDPRYAVAFGRREYASDYGYWWDDALESVSLTFNDGSNSGLLALGKPFYRYNTDENDLPEAENDSLYLLTEYRHNRDNAAYGVRFMLEQTASDNSEYQAYKGGRAGVFTTWKGPGLVDSLYWEVMVVEGDLDVPAAAGEDQAVHGWASLLELVWELDQAAYAPSLLLRVGLTDKPSNEYDGFFLNPLQSDRVSNEESYSNGLAGNFVRLNFSNLLFYGVVYRSRPQPRTWLDVGVFDLQLRSKDGTLPIAVAPGKLDPEATELGQVIDLNLYWKMFPGTYDRNPLNINWLLSGGYFIPGDAIVDTSNQFQISTGVEVRF